MAESKSDVQQLLDVVNGKLAEIGDISNNQMRTNGKFRFSPASSAGQTIDLFTSTSVSKLIEIHAFLTAKRTGYLESAKALNLNIFPTFKWLEFGLDDWINDIEVRVRLVTQKDQIELLTQSKKELEGFLTESDRKAMTLKKVSGLLDIKLGLGEGK